LEFFISGHGFIFSSRTPTIQPGDPKKDQGNRTDLSLPGEKFDDSSDKDERYKFRRLAAPGSTGSAATRKLRERSRDLGKRALKYPGVGTG